ncbi:MAG TPA: hypothetical protein VNK04_26645, partial [Gemmataceae bacterium]|nr:hypothetical protein [Gemmataceae bacterium]
MTAGLVGVEGADGLAARSGAGFSGLPARAGAADGGTVRPAAAGGSADFSGLAAGFAGGVPAVGSRAATGCDLGTFSFARRGCDGAPA